MRFPYKALILCMSLIALLSSCRGGEDRSLGNRLSDRSTNAEIPAGVEQAEITVNGEQRSFLYYAPATRSANPGVVLGLHGGRGSGATFLGQTPSMLSYADALGFIAVYPNANGNWNDGRVNFADRPSDVAFLSAVIDWMAVNFAADRNRVFVTGASNGGAMTYKMACDAPELVAGIAPIISSLTATLYADCNPNQPVPVVMFNGTADPLNVYDGGRATSRLAGFAPQEDTMTGVEVTAGFWARVNGCGTGTTAEDLPDRANDGTTVTLIRYDCPSSAVWLYRINGGGHTVPGMAPTGPRAERLVGRTSQDIDAAGLAVAFFQRYGL